MSTADPGRADRTAGITTSAHRARPGVPSAPRVPEPDVARHLTPAPAGDLAGVTLTGVDLTGADLTVAELDELQIEASALDRLRAASGRWVRTALADCRVEGADLANLHAEELSLLRCSLRDARLVGAQLPGARLRGVRLDGARASLTSWRGASWQHVVLHGADLSEADLTGATLTDVLLQDCDLTGAQLSQVRCERVRLSGCRLAGIAGVRSLRGASVAEADAYQLLPLLARDAGITIAD